jgi:hypothetical protein
VKHFTSVQEAAMWCRKVLEVGATDGIATITEDLYKWSRPYTFRRTGQTYGDLGGADPPPTLDFKNGLIIQRSPQARKLYYMGGVANSQHPQGQARWWEKTKRVHATDMKKQAIKILNEVKKK